MQALLRGQAQIDAAQGAAVAQLITSLENTPDAIIQIGSVLLVKADGVLAVRNLTQIELAHLERHPDLFRSPAAILDELKLVTRIRTHADRRALTGDPGHDALPPPP
jgi:hypothetical protein